MSRKRNSAGTAAGALFALLLSASGCVATSVPSPESTPLRDFLARSRSGDLTYRMRPGDRLTTRFFYNPQLDQEFTVRPDGRVQLKLVGELQASGKTTKQFSAELTKLYAHYFIKSSCVVILRETSAFRMFTAGQLRNPGQIDLITGARTVLDSLAMSGGVTEDGTLSHVYLIRTLPGAKSPIIAELNLKDALSGEDPSQDVELMPDDYVFVPLSSMAHLNLALQSYLYRNLNFTTGVGVGTGFAINATPQQQTAAGRINTTRPNTGNNPPATNMPPMMNVPPAAATPNTNPATPITPARP